MNRYLKNKNAITGRVNEELVRMDIDRGKYFSLNNVATRIWEILDVPLGMEEIGLQLMQAIRNIDYPLISGCTLIISVTMLMANFLIDVIYGLIDPRVRSAQVEEG